MPGAALFTLVGIAGEDDLDAPDLIDAISQTEKLSAERKSVGNGGGQASLNRRAGRGSANKLCPPSRNTELSAALSASLRVELLRQIDGLGALDNAALWAQRRLPAKNQLSATDAQQVEEAFAAKLAAIQAQSAKSHDVLSKQSLAERTSPPTQINKSVLTFPEPRRVRDRDHIRHVIKQPCLVCGSSALRPTPPPFRTISRAGPQGQRRVHGAALSRASS